MGIGSGSSMRRPPAEISTHFVCAYFMWPCASSQPTRTMPTYGIRGYRRLSFLDKVLLLATILSAEAGTIFSARADPASWDLRWVPRADSKGFHDCARRK